MGNILSTFRSALGAILRIGVILWLLASMHLSVAETLYDLLEVPPNATPHELKMAKRSLNMRLHPDRTKGDLLKESRLMKVNEAYDVLSDPIKREDYDRQNPNPTPYKKNVAREFTEFLFGLNLGDSDVALRKSLSFLTEILKNQTFSSLLDDSTKEINDPLITQLYFRTIALYVFSFKIKSPEFFETSLDLINRKLYDLSKKDPRRKTEFYKIIQWVYSLNSCEKKLNPISLEDLVKQKYQEF